MSLLLYPLVVCYRGLTQPRIFYKFIKVYDRIQNSNHTSCHHSSSDNCSDNGSDDDNDDNSDLFDDLFLAQKYFSEDLSLQNHF